MTLSLLALLLLLLSTSMPTLMLCCRRGRVWGPHLMLMYWALRNPAYANVTSVATARSALLDMGVEMLLAEWGANRHVMENYNGMTGYGEDGSSGVLLATCHARLL